MQFGSTSVEKISFELRRNLSDIARKVNFSDRSVVEVITTGPEYQVWIPKRKVPLLLLAAVHWYFPENGRCLIKLELETKYERCKDPEVKIPLGIMLSSEPECILYIMESNVFGNSTEDVFGLIRGTQLKFGIRKYYPRKPKQGQRHRGYLDKGTLSKISYIRREEARDAFLNERYLAEERDQLAFLSAVSWSLGFIQ